MTDTKTKRIPPSAIEAFGRTLKRWISEHCDGNQIRAAEVLGMNQGHISAIISGLRGPGLNVMIHIRPILGMSIDDMMELPPLKKDVVLRQGPHGTLDTVTELQALRAILEMRTEIQSLRTELEQFRMKYE